MLSARGVEAPTVADVEAVLAELDPPASYAEEAVSISAGEPLPAEPRFSRTAIVGGAWVALAVATPFIGFCAHKLDPPMVNLAWWQKLLVVPLAATLVTAPVGVTTLGIIAVWQTRRAKGRLCGMGLALADAVCYPLLALDALIALAIFLLVAGVVYWLLPNHAHPLRYLFLGLDLILAVPICLYVDFRIVRWLWRMVCR